MAKIFGICFMVVFTATLIMPLYFMLKTDRELSKQIEALRKKLQEENEEFNELNQNENEQ